MTRRSWKLVIAVALIATGVAAATFLVLRHRTDNRLAGWEEIEKAGQGRTVGRGPAAARTLDRRPSRRMASRESCWRITSYGTIAATRPSSCSAPSGRRIRAGPAPRWCWAASRSSRGGPPTPSGSSVPWRIATPARSRPAGTCCTCSACRCGRPRRAPSSGSSTAIDEDPQVLVNLVLELLTDPDIRGLGPELELLVAQTPDDPLLSRAWGMSLLYQGRAEEALPHLEAAARSLVNDPSGRFALAECLLILGRPVDAERILGPVPERPVDASQWWLYRGRLEESTGLADRSISSFERAAELNPQNREAQFRLGQALKRLGRAGPAAEHLARAGRIEEGAQGGAPRAPASPAGRDLLGSRLLRTARSTLRRCRTHRRGVRLVRAIAQARSRRAKRAGPGWSSSAPCRRTCRSRCRIPDWPRSSPAPSRHGSQRAVSVDTTTADRRGPEGTGPAVRGRRGGRGHHLLLRERGRGQPAPHRRYDGRRGRTDRLRQRRLAGHLSRQRLPPAVRRQESAAARTSCTATSATARSAT